jgi:uncharacterized protein (TIGR03083 family)
MSPWDEIKADRLVLADYLAALTPAEWAAKSLCADWNVKAVTTHLLVTPTMTKGQVFKSFLLSGFNLDKMSAKLVGQMTASMTTDQIVAKLRETASSQSSPPGLKPIGVFGETVVHASDISLALGKPLELPISHYVTVLNHFKNVQPIMGCKKRIAGLKLKATDTDWSTGEGPLVEGTAQYLLSAMTGRTSSLSALSGEGVADLRTRN